MKIQPRNFYSSWSREELLTFEKRATADTGIKKIDDNFGFPAGFYVIAGSPGSGKGWFALWISRQFNIHNRHSSVYFSLEMSEQLVRTRALQQWSNLTKEQLELAQPNQTKVAMEALSSDVLIVDEFYSDNHLLQTPDNFKEKIEEYYKYGYRVFHFDHMHELSGANDNNRNQQTMERWSYTFQLLTKLHKDIWLFIYVQPNGKGYDKNLLKRSDISGSKVVIQKCDYFLSINREQVDSFENESRDIYLYLDKNRYTDLNHKAFKLYFDKTGNYYSTIGLNE